MTASNWSASLTSLITGRSPGMGASCLFLRIGHHPNGERVSSARAHCRSDARPSLTAELERGVRETSRSTPEQRPVGVTMPEEDRRPGPDVQQCPSCASTAVLRRSAEDDATVSFVCRRCDLRWSITERRAQKPARYVGLERRRDGAFGGWGEEEGGP